MLTVSLCTSPGHSKPAPSKKKKKKKIRAFLKTPSGLCNREYHMWDAYTSTAHVTKVQENISCFVLKSHWEVHSWEVHKTQTMLYVLAFSIAKQGLNTWESKLIVKKKKTGCIKYVYNSNSQRICSNWKETLSRYMSMWKQLSLSHKLVIQTSN